MATKMTPVVMVVVVTPETLMMTMKTKMITLAVTDDDEDTHKAEHHVYHK